MSLGKFYIAINTNLWARDLWADIERIATSNQPRSSIVKCGLEDIQMNAVQVQVKECTEQIQKLVATVQNMLSEMSPMK